MLPSAQRRVALVIGNSNYDIEGSWLKALPNAAADAKAVAHRLRELGFELLTNGAILDAGKDAIEGAVEQFHEALEAAQLGIVYYAGHGIALPNPRDREQKEQVFVVPIGADLSRWTRIEFSCIDVRKVHDPHGKAVQLVVLDACRDDPFTVPRSSFSSTLPFINKKGAYPDVDHDNLFLWFSTSQGATASDGSAGRGRSPFTDAFLTALDEPDLDLRTLAKRVSEQLKSAPGGVSLRQTPEFLCSKRAPDVYLNPRFKRSRTPAEIAQDTLAASTFPRAGEDWIRKFLDDFGHLNIQPVHIVQLELDHRREVEPREAAEWEMVSKTLEMERQTKARERQLEEEVARTQGSSQRSRADLSGSPARA